MTDQTNRQYFLASRPAGMPTTDNVQCRDVPLAEPGDGEVTIKNLYISLDPAIRGWMDDTPNYIEPIAIGAAVRCSAIGACWTLRVARWCTSMRALPVWWRPL